MIEFAITVFICLAAICLCLAYLWILALLIEVLSDWIAGFRTKPKPKPPVDPKYDPYWKTRGQK